MAEKTLRLNNGKLLIEIVNPANLDDNHFSTRYSYCGYIKQITHLPTSKKLLEMPFKPFVPFHGEGFPEEFEMPINYNTVKKGGDFIKVGVGILNRTSRDRYSSENKHTIKYKAPVTVEQNGNKLMFSQGITVGTYGYYYKKQILLNKDFSFSICHSITNSGMVAWKSLWYSHAFLALGGHKKGLTFYPTANCHETKTNHNLAKSGNAYIWNGVFGKIGFCTNYSVKPSLPNYHKVIDANHKYSFEAEGDYGYQELQLYVNKRVFSPEPKLSFELKPGSSMEWSTKYTITALK